MGLAASCYHAFILHYTKPPQLHLQPTVRYTVTSKDSWLYRKGSKSYSRLPAAIVVFGAWKLHILYIDESGDTGQLPAQPGANDQPVFLIGALIVDAANVGDLTHDFIDLKSRFYPGLVEDCNKHLDRILPEIKGSDLRRNALRGRRNVRRHAIGFLEKLLEILQNHDVRLLSRVWVKPLGQRFEGRAVYTSSIQWLYASFENFLHDQDSLGFCIADSRDPLNNAIVAHSVFTQKFQSSSAAYNRALELPTFAHSENHAGIQICDILCSALLYPIAAEAYCSGHVGNIHVQPSAAALRERFGAELQTLQYRYQEPLGKWNGGIVVSDPVGLRNAAWMFSL